MNEEIKANHALNLQPSQSLKCSFSIASWEIFVRKYMGVNEEYSYTCSCQCKNASHGYYFVLI